MLSRSHRNQVTVTDDKVRVHVTAPPERGRANEAAISLLADRLGVAKSRIRVMRGQRARNKVVLVEGLAPETVMERLRQ